MLLHAILGIFSGLVAGIMAGAFGVGGAIITTPAVQVLLDARPIVAVGTPLPAIIPTTLSGMHAYHRARQIDYRGVIWAAPPGIVGSVGGALVTKVVEPRILLLATAVLIGWQAVQVGWGSSPPSNPDRPVHPPGWAFAAMGLVAGFASGLLGIGGGIVMVPVMSSLLHMPLKRAIGTSLVIIAFMVVPGTAVHAALGHINWAIFLWLSVGVVPGAAIGSRWTIRARERTLRLVVGSFLLVVSVSYGIFEVFDLLRH